ncbi:MAG: LmeA family phospholipid-binding protein [Thermoanaerobaculia bacterium]
MLGAVNLLWLSKNTRLPTWDPFNHLVSGMKYHHALSDFFEGKVTLRSTASALLRVDDHYPPLAPLAASPAFAAEDPRAATFFLNQAALAILIFATYALGKRHSSEAAGVLAAMAVTAFPMVSMQSREFMLDLPDAAMTSMALLALWRAERFRRPGPSLLFGLALGLALLTKWTVVFFLAAPLAFEILRAAREDDRWERLRNAAAGLLAAAAMSFPWYGTHLWNLARDSGKFSYGVGVREGDPPILSPRSLLFYASSLVAAVLLPWALLFLAGLGLAARDRFRRSGLLALSIAGGWTILTLVRNKDARYVIPMLPAVAVLAVSALDAFPIPFRARAAFVAAFAAVSIGIGWKRNPPAREKWPVQEAVAFLARQPVARPRLRVVPDWPYFERHGFEYFAESARSPIDVGSWFQFPTFTDFVVVKTGEQGEREEASRLMADIENPRGDFPSLFRPVWERPLPDGSRAMIFKREISPVPAEPSEVIGSFKAAALAFARRYVTGLEGAEIDVETISPVETRRGHFQRVVFRAESGAIAGKKSGGLALPVRRAALEVRDLTVDPYCLLREGRIEILALGDARPSVEVDDAGVNAYLAALPRFSGRVHFANATITAEGRLRGGGPGISLEVEPRIVGGDNIGFITRRFSVAGVPAPSWLASALTAGNNPILKPMPCRLRLETLRVENGILAVNE